PTSNTPQSSLHRVLVGRGPGMARVPERVEPPSDDEVVVYLEAWQSRGGPVWRPAVPVEAAAELPSDDDPALAVRRFEREVDTAWRRTSYSALSAHTSAALGLAAAVDSEPENPPRADEPDGADPVPG